MALTSVTAGTLASTSLWNQYYNLLTGAMADQEVTINNNLVLKGLGAAPTTPSCAVVAGAGLGIGTYKYQLAYQSADGESKPSSTATVTTTSGNQQVQVPLTAGPTGTTGIVVYRTTVGGSTF